jgi:transposase
MTTTDLAVIDNGTAQVELLSKTEAKKLDKQIRSKSDQAVNARDKAINLFDELTQLLSRAKEGEIHKALGIKSWPAYVADAVSIPVAPERDDRKQLVQFLSGQGMSQRAIASTLNVSQKTVDRDLDGEAVENGATVTSLDGAQRPKNGKAKEEPEVIDGEVIGEEDDSPVPMTAVEIVNAFGEEMGNLWNAHAELVELTKEDKWAGARKRIIKADLNNLGEIVKALQGIVDDLMEE